MIQHSIEIAQKWPFRLLTHTIIKCIIITDMITITIESSHTDCTLLFESYAFLHFGEIIHKYAEFAICGYCWKSTAGCLDIITIPLQWRLLLTILLQVLNARIEKLGDSFDRILQMNEHLLLSLAAHGRELLCEASKAETSGEYFYSLPFLLLLCNILYAFQRQR